MKYVPYHVAPLLSAIVIAGVIQSAQLLAADNPQIELAAHVEPLPGFPQGPFVRLGDGGILGVRESKAIVTHDDGKTWKRHPIFKPGQPFSIRPELTLLRTRRGVIVLIFANNAVLKYSWDKKNNLPKPDMHLPSYAIRSLDDGRTWTDLSLLHDGWCGCNQDAIETNTGNIVVPGQELSYDKGRHITKPYLSSDAGKTWKKMRTLDIGGRGDHAGAIEGTLEQLRDGRIWLLLRSYHGFFYESFSSDQGLTWSDLKPSKIKKRWTRMVAFGDSTTAPRGKLLVYADLLQRELPQKGVDASVINAGEGSSTTDHARKRFQHDVLARKPELVIVQFGINDAAVDVWKTPPAQKPRVALSRYKENLGYFIDTLHQQQVKVVLMTPNPMRWTPKLRQLYGKSPYDPAKPDGFNIILKQYAEAVRQLAKEKQVNLVDVYGIYEAYDRQPNHSMDELLLDGMHPNQKGQRLAADRLKEMIP